MMKPTNKTCKLESKEDCVKPPGFVGGDLRAYEGKTCDEALAEANKSSESTSSENTPAESTTAEPKTTA